MDLKEIDVALFVTCRLCLADTGVFQIVPAVQEQIKFCYDIIIEPFDGLSQLICKKCKTIVSDCFSIKTEFIKKQKDLHDKIHNNQTTNLRNETEIKKTQTESSNSTSSAKKNSSKTKQESWKDNYNKLYVCKVCNKQSLKYSSFKNHLRTHSAFLRKYNGSFKPSIVKLIKVDGKPNMTGSSKLIVYNNDKIISAVQPVDNYYITYESIYKTKTLIESNGAMSRSVVRRHASSEFSDCDVIRKKNPRFCINSSTEASDNGKSKDCTTVDRPVEVVENIEVVHNKNTRQRKIVKFLSEKTVSLSRLQPIKPSIVDYKSIQNIITMCQKKYLKKLAAKKDIVKNPSFSESSLKHKILSIGRKVINKQGFGCTGLLRYMEHKDLDIHWLPTVPAVPSKKASYVRIMTKIKAKEDLENDDVGWVSLPGTLSFRESVELTRNLQIIKTDNIQNNNNIDPVIVESSVQEHCENDLLLSSEAYLDTCFKKKILNESPVDNPKQLPKKIIINDKKNNVLTNEKSIPQITKSNTKDCYAIALDTNTVKPTATNSCMPLVISNISLSSKLEKENQNNTVDSTEKPIPRIKVKSVSELMSESALNNQEISTSRDNFWTSDEVQVGQPYPLKWTVFNVSSPLDDNPPTGSMLRDSFLNSNITPPGENLSDSISLINQEFVTLHTSELPNTKTKSPIQYFKTLLLYHGLVLLESNETLPENYNCLIKFRLKMEQDTKRPVILLLSLFCFQNIFCFLFQDKHLVNVDPNQLPAYWQWELLKPFRGNVIDKTLENASKIGKDVYYNTNNFLCVLKSIKYV